MVNLPSIDSLTQISKKCQRIDFNEISDKNDLFHFSFCRKNALIITGFKSLIELSKNAQKLWNFDLLKQKFGHKIIDGLLFCEKFRFLHWYNLLKLPRFIGFMILEYQNIWISWEGKVTGNPKKRKKWFLHFFVVLVVHSE